MTPTALESALCYGARGWPVLPCNGKVPLTPNGCKNASTDPERIRAWFRRWPHANVAITTGTASGLYVLDVDNQAALVGRELPETRTVCTGSGGLHYYFERPKGERWGNTASKIAAGLDTRGDGGYVIAPPSVHPETGEPYVVASDFDLAPVPTWVLDALRPKPPAPRRDPRPLKAPSSAYAAKALDDEILAVATAPKGSRNHQLNVSAYSLGQLVGAGLLSAAEVSACLDAAAERGGLGSRERERTIESGLAAGMREPRHVPERRERTRAISRSPATPATAHMGSRPRPGAFVPWAEFDFWEGLLALSECRDDEVPQDQPEQAIPPSYADDDEWWDSLETDPI